MNELYEEEPELNDELLRDRLRTYAPSAPDSVWSRVEARLPERKEKRPVLFLWIIGTGLLLLWLRQGVHNTRCSQSTEEPSSSPMQIQAMGQPMQVLPTLSKDSYTEYTGHQILEGSPVTVQKLSEPMRTDGTSRPRLLKELPRPNTSVSEDTENGASASEPSFSAAETRPVNTPEVQQEEAQRHVLETLPMRGGKLQPQSTESAHAVFSVIPPSTVSYSARNHNGFEIGFGVGSLHIIRNQTPEATAPGHNLLFSEEIHTSSGMQLGISIAYRLGKRWRIESGVWRQSSLQHTSHSAQLRLMDGVCLNPDDPGIKNYEFQYGLLTDAGPSDVTVRIAQVDPHVSMPADEPFTLYMNTTRRSIDWTIPLTVQRLIGNGPWQIALRAGSAGSMRSKTVLSVDHFTEECIDLCFASDHRPVVKARQEQVFALQYVAGAGLVHQLMPRLSVQLEPIISGTIWSSEASRRQTRITINVQANYAF